MPFLKEGDSGPKVRELQERLRERGFNPGEIDGVFGPGTEAAIMAFQRSEGLLEDGKVGPRTLERLGLAGDMRMPSIDVAGVTPAIVSKMFPFAPLGNIKTHLPNVMKALVTDQLTERNMVLVALSTIRAESAGFAPINEFISRFNTSPGGRQFDLYDNMRTLGNQGPPDGERFRGRGFIQLTGRFNYKKFGDELGIPLIENPELANDSEIAARLLARFMKAKELAIKTALLENDLKAVRRLINGGSHGLDHFKEAFQIGGTLIPTDEQAEQQAASAGAA
jgi:peptidoglycan L-alanyl-D-glutamate endopeptidase CwlK